MVRENVPAPEGHVCNESWHDDAIVARVRNWAELIRDAADDMFREHRQSNVLKMATRVIDGLPHQTSSDKFRHKESRY